MVRLLIFIVGAIGLGAAVVSMDRGILFWALIAVLYALSLIPFVMKKDWPSVLISFGCVLVLMGNIWSASRGTQ